jgi:hypothetical protein
MALGGFSVIFKDVSVSKGCGLSCSSEGLRDL